MKKLYKEINNSNYPAYIWIDDSVTFQPLYNSANTYDPGETVQENTISGFEVYIAKSAVPLNTTPSTNPTFWQKNSEFGESTDYITDLHFGGIVAGMDMIAIRDEIQSHVVDFNNLNADQKAIIDFWQADDGTNLIPYYMNLYSENQDDATDRYTINFTTNHVEIIRPAANERVNCKKVTRATLHYLKDRDEIDRFTDETRHHKNDFRDDNHKGLNYGDNRDGIMDYLESTGSYAPDKGLAMLKFSQRLIDKWVNDPANGVVDPQNPTQAELQAASDSVRMNMIQDIKGPLIFGDKAM